MKNNHNHPPPKDSRHDSSMEVDEMKRHPAECGKQIRTENLKNESPWGPLGIIFDVFCSRHSDFQLITINGREAESYGPADWQSSLQVGF